MFRIDKRNVNITSYQNVSANISGIGTSSPGRSIPVLSEGESPALSPNTKSPEMLVWEQKNAAINEKELEIAAKTAEIESKKAEIEKQRAELEELRKKASEILAKANLEVDLLIQSAELEAREIKSAAWQAGYVEGRQEAERSLDSQIADGAESIRRLLDEIQLSWDNLFDEIEDEVLDLTLAVVKKIINKAIEDDDKIFESMLLKALRQMKWEGKISIRVNKDEFERFFSSGSATFVLGDESLVTTMISDPTLAPGGCIIESDGETINAGLDSQLKQIALAFHKSGGTDS